MMGDGPIAGNARYRLFGTGIEVLECRYASAAEWRAIWPTWRYYRTSIAVNLAIPLAADFIWALASPHYAG